MAKINEEFFNSTADATIHKLQRRVVLLEHKIEEFKEYDKKRNEYYKDAMIRLGQLESFVEELADESKIIEKYKKCRERKAILEKKEFLNKIAQLSDIEIVSTYDKFIAERKYKRVLCENRKVTLANRALVSQILDLKKQIDDLSVKAG